jgi:hypothetical protein
VTPDDKHDDYGFRVFTESRLRLLPDDDWGMELETPDWVQDVHNKFDGRCYLFGTGPSLVEQLPLLERLKDAKTFTCNRAKKWKELPFTPWLHCVTELSRDVRRAGRQIWDTTPGGRINQEGAMTFVDLEELL